MPPCWTNAASLGSSAPNGAYRTCITPSGKSAGTCPAKAERRIARTPKIRQDSNEVLKNAAAPALAVPAENATGAGPAARNASSSSVNGAWSPWSYSGKPASTIPGGQSGCRSAYQSGNRPIRQSASLIHERKILASGGRRSVARNLLSGFVAQG